MLLAPHITVGALIGRTARRAWLALPLAFASHCLLDALPHPYFTVRDSAALPLKLAFIGGDAVLGFALVYWIARGQANWRLILWSAFAAVLLDLMNPVTPLGRWLAHTPGTAWLISQHFKWAWHTPFGRQWLLGLGPSVAVLVVASLIVWRLQKSRPKGKTAGYRVSA